ncbi:MAG: c-type cytochrome domain-containing protein [Rubripirellula sp.]
MSILLICITSVFANRSVHADNESTFDAVAPVLIRHCLQCHQSSEPGGGLKLTTAETLAAGGDSGPPTNNSSLTASLLWDRISSGEMPPESILSDAELASIKAWIKDGTPWQDRTLHLFDITTDQNAGADWWSLQPLKQPTIPHDFHNEPNPIDAFIKAKQQSSGLALSPAADPGTLFRPQSLHLHGMNPSQKNHVDLTAFNHRYNEHLVRGCPMAWEARQTNCRPTS